MLLSELCVGMDCALDFVMKRVVQNNRGRGRCSVEFTLGITAVCLYIWFRLWGVLLEEYELEVWYRWYRRLRKEWDTRKPRFKSRVELICWHGSRVGCIYWDVLVSDREREGGGRVYCGGRVWNATPSQQVTPFWRHTPVATMESPNENLVCYRTKTARWPFVHINNWSRAGFTWLEKLAFELRSVREV